MATKILVLAAGRTALPKHPDRFPVCLTEIENKNILERIVENTANIDNKHFVFTFLKSESQRFHLGLVAQQVAPGCNVNLVPELTEGSGCTALLSASQLDPDNEILIISANELVNLDLSLVVDDFRSRDLDAGTITFEATHPRYSYVLLNEEDLIEEAAQHRPISRTATTGVFWFKRTGAFVDALKAMIMKRASVNGAFFIAPALNELILKQRRLGVYRIDHSLYLPIKQNLISSPMQDEEDDL